MKLLLAVLVGLVSCGLALADSSTTAKTAPAPAITAVAKAVPAPVVAKPAPVKVVEKDVSGNIVSVDIITGTLVIKEKKISDTIAVNDKTAIKIGGKVSAFADLKASDTKTKITYKTEDGKKIAEKISAKALPAVKVKDTTVAKSKDTVTKK